MVRKERVHIYTHMEGEGREGKEEKVWMVREETEEER